MRQLEDLYWAALSSRETVDASYLLAKAAIEAGIPGDFVECGVFAGVQCAAMARGMRDAIADTNGDPPNAQRSRPWRRVHLFDSFDGVPEAGPHDIGWTHPKGVSACELDKVLGYMQQWGVDRNLLVFHPGPFDKTLLRLDEPVPVKQIAILRLDADLYESTKVCLEHLYPLVVPGGWVIVDDYALPGCRKAVDEYFGKGIGPIYWQRSA